MEALETEAIRFFFFAYKYDMYITPKYLEKPISFQQ